MKILFIDPQGMQEPLKNKPSIGLNRAFATLAPILVKHGHQVSVIDMVNHYFENKTDSIKKSLNIFKPDLIGISVLNAQYKNALNIIKILREITDIPIITGGAEVTAIEEKIFYETDFAINVSVLGEGEETIVKIVECFEKKDMTLLEGIKGIIINRNSKIIKTGSTQMVEDLNKYPFPDFGIYGVKRLNFYKIMGSRGCPFKCSFCFSYLGSSWREREPKNVIRELEEAKEKFGFHMFRFLDPVFNFKIAWVHEICDAIIKSGLYGLPWEVPAMRADKCNDDIFKHMVDAGCKRIGLGVESLHPEVFKLIKKGETIDQLKNSVKLATKYFRRVLVSMVIGLPGDTKKRCLYSYNELKKLKPTDLSYALAVPYSGTRMEKWAEESAQILGTSYDSYTRGSLGFNSGIAFETEDFTKEERLETFKIINTKEFKYVSKSEFHRFLDPMAWLRDAFKYDKNNFCKHALFVSNQIYSRFANKQKRLFYDTKLPPIEYERIPDGTWWVGNGNA